MVSARDAYDDWYDDHDEPYTDNRGRWHEPRSRWDEEPGPRRLTVVRPAPLAFELIQPADFECAQRIADRLRDGASVVVDFELCDRDLTGRLMDFASGLVYALGGGLQHVGDRVVLLTPSHLRVSGDEASDVRASGFYNRI